MKINNNIIIISIFILAIILRCYYFDVNQQIMGDEGVYYYGALNLINHNTVTYDYVGNMYANRIDVVPSPSIIPGYIFFLALLYNLFGISIEIARYINILLSVISLVYMYRIMCLLNIRVIFKNSILFLAAIYPGFIYNTQRILTENLFLLLLLMAVFYYLLDWEKYNLNINTILVGICFAGTFFLKPVAIGMIVLIILSIGLNNHNTYLNRIRKIGFYLFPLVTCIILWIIRNYISFGEIFFSKAGNGPIVWGILPYFIGIQEIKEINLKEIFYGVFNVNPWLFLKWKIFGHLQYMWGDIWDENLTHPFLALKYLGLEHFFVILPSLIMIPKIIKKHSLKFIPIVFLPILFTIFYMFFHGLPRYVWPSIPFLFISIAIYFSDDMEEGVRLDNFITIKYKKILEIIAIIFSSLILISVFVFSWFVNKEMYEYGLLYRGNIRIENLSSNEIIYNKRFYLEDNNISVTGWKVEKNNLYNDKRTGIIRLDNLKLKDCSDKIVTKVDIVGDGGFLFDYCTIYWKFNNDEQYNENLVYRFPTNTMQKHRVVYIYGNIDSIMTVPIVLKNGKYNYQYIEISKIKCN